MGRKPPHWIKPRPKEYNNKEAEWIVWDQPTDYGFKRCVATRVVTTHIEPEDTTFFEDYYDKVWNDKLK